jgi:acetyltransferase-like isoleucine patch superfamily enzyme
MVPWIDSPPAGFKVHYTPRGEPIYVHKLAELNNITIGRFSYIAGGTYIGGRYPVVIGAFCSIAHNVYCSTCESHQTRFVSTFPMRTALGIEVDYPELVEKPDGVKIGNDVWIGHQARIMAGVTLGDGCVIGASSVVTRNCEPYGIYAGVPAQLRHKRCPDMVIGQLLEICWWTWPFDRIRRNARFFSADLGHLEVSLASLVTP